MEAGETQGWAPRRTTAVGVMVLVLVVATALVTLFLTQPHEPGGGQATLRVSDSVPSDAPSAEPSDSPSVEPSATASATATPSTEQTSASPSDSGGSTGGSGGSAGSGSSSGQVMSDLGPVPPGSVVYGYEAGRHVWSGTSHGIDMTVRMSPSQPHAGETVTFDIHASAAAHCCYGYMVFGNGRGTPDVHCMQAPSGTSFDVEYTTIYNREGRYEFIAGVMTPSHQSCGNQGDIYAWIQVGPGTSTDQGPSLPVVQVDNSTPPPKHQNDPAWMTLWGHARDDDGYLTKLIVDWGDGTSATYSADGGTCVRGSDGWPAPTEADVPYDPPPPHHYTSYGTFHIRLTAVSTACGGGDVQRGSATMTWSNPAPPSPDPSPTATASA